MDSSKKNDENKGLILALSAYSPQRIRNDSSISASNLYHKFITISDGPVMYLCT